MFTFLQNSIKKPENIFLVFCLFWGVILTFINPLFQSFDEPEHFYKIYAFTEGTLNYKKITSYTDGTLTFDEPKTFSAQIIPINIVRISVENKTLNPYFDEKRVIYKPQKIKISDTIRQSQYSLDKNFKTIAVHMIPSYTVVSYLPHTLVLTIMKQFSAKPAFMIFMLRLCSLFLYTALIYAAIKITPVKKLLFLFLSVTPLALYLSATINTDHFVIGLGFLLTAYTLKLKYDENISQIEQKHLIIFFTLIFLLCVCKFTYLPMILLFFIIPEQKFESEKKRILSFLFLTTACLLWIAVYLSYNIHIFKGLFSYYNKNASEAIVSIFTQPLSFLTSIFNTVKANSIEYTQRIFSDFGCSDTQIGSGLIYSYIALIIFNVLFADKQKDAFKLTDKIIFFIIIFSVLFASLSANYIIFQLSPQGLIEGFKGRYLIPVLPLLFMLFDNNKLKPLKINLPLITLLYALLLVFVFCITLINRYYI